MNIFIPLKVGGSSDNTVWAVPANIMIGAVYLYGAVEMARFVGIL
jgi:hypothetical protein